MGTKGNKRFKAANLILKSLDRNSQGPDSGNWLAVSLGHCSSPFSQLASSRCSSLGTSLLTTRLSLLRVQLSLHIVSCPAAHPNATFSSLITWVLPEHIVGAVHNFPCINFCNPHCPMAWAYGSFYCWEMKAQRELSWLP